ncbi:MAG: hypothetical protein QXF58_06400 [Desulfurococcaceae archaeon]
MAEYTARDHVVFMGEVMKAYEGPSKNPLTWINAKSVKSSENTFSVVFKGFSIPG